MVSRPTEPLDSRITRKTERLRCCRIEEALQQIRKAKEDGAEGQFYEALEQHRKAKEDEALKQLDKALGQIDEVLEQSREVYEEVIEEFCNDYLAANPPQPATLRAESSPETKADTGKQEADKR